MSGYVGRGINYGNAVVDHFTGNGGATYTLNYDTTTNGVVVSLDGVVQKNGTDFNVTGTSLVFTSTVSSPIAIQVIYTGLTLSIGTPGDGTVTNAKVDASAAIATSKVSGAVTSIASHGLGTSATVDTGTSANQIVKLDGSAKIPAVDGSQLTNLPSDITKSTSEPTGTTNPSGGVGTIWLRTTTGEMYCCTDATTNANVWTNIGEGTGAQPYTGMAATGGTITTDGDYKVHTFNSSGTFTITTLGNDAVLEYLVIAGGGATGASGGGGGGAGGYRTATNFSVSAQAYTITVGAGGTGATGTGGTSGSDSTFSTITSTGGGKGSGTTGAPNSGSAGADGGSGGGGTWLNSGAGSAGGSGTAGQGNDGGTGGIQSGAHAGGGGGGAGAAGTNGSTSAAGNGGNGLSSSITGSAVTRGGGGGGAAHSTGTGGTAGTGGGGGGYGSSGGTTSSGTANTGGGGGGANAGNGGSGGSGVVILRYKFQ